jgi:hypothetical protein
MIRLRKELPLIVYGNYDVGPADNLHQRPLRPNEAQVHRLA